MFIITKKIPRRRVTAAAFLFLLTLGLFGAGLDLSGDIRAASAVIQAETSPDPTGIRTNAQRIAYLEAYGWLTADQAAAEEEILLPETFGPDYQAYLELQTSQGFDLESWAGKTVKRYTYQIKNYPGLRENIWASILVYKHTVVGGEVFCSEGDGFTQSLVYPARQG